jgi:Kdo2-lipid IVA lauroyltransferase/acyltransferase
MSTLGIWFMRAIAPLPLGLLRGFGTLFGLLLYALAVTRRRVAMTNLRLCFPELTDAQRKSLCRQHFVVFAQAWLDRSWLWHGSESQLASRLKITGAIDQLKASAQPTVLFAPHFVGLDAGWTALTQQIERHFTTIYTPQRNLAVDAWIREGRERFNGPTNRARLFHRIDGVKTIVAALRQGAPLYLLPDMNFGEEESLFVPFFGVQAATVPSLSRFAKLGRAQVIPVLNRMTTKGYEIEVLAAWSDFPTSDLEADTATMNRRLEDFIRTMPHQYYWVHKRFKSRPAGEAGVY